MSNTRLINGRGPETAFSDNQVLPTVGFVSTYPPAMCGLATFTSSLRAAMATNRGSDKGLDVVEVVDDGPGGSAGRPEVVAQLNPENRESLENATAILAEYDAVVLQHEYGIWGPDMGVAVLDLVDRLGDRLITTLHTLLPWPTPIQERIIESVVERSAHTVVPTQAAKLLLAERYNVDGRSVVVIPHGTDAPHRSVARLRAIQSRDHRAPRLLTWGLIGPGKGLEWSLRAVALLKDRYPGLRYTIAGRTHPKVLAREGEAYREMLEGIVEDQGLRPNVGFIDDYLPEELLHRLLLDTTVVVLPYDSTDQIVSGVLVEAVSANIPVIATAFPHAVELAGSGSVTTVPHRSPEAIASSFARLFDSTVALSEMVKAQRRVAPDLEWEGVARQYDRLIGGVARSAVAMSHVPPAS